MKPIFLIGFMGSGKSSVGKRLSHNLETNFIDTDNFIEIKNNKNIPDIFKKEGEDKFRYYEASVLKEVSESANANDVIATGGGIVETVENYATMSQKGYIIYLRTNLEEIYKRLKRDTGRPLWDNNNVGREALYKRRIIMYETWSDYIVDTGDKSIDEVVKQIKRIIAN